MRSNRQISFTLVARLVNGQPADGKALAHALLNKISDQQMLIQRLWGVLDSDRMNPV